MWNASSAGTSLAFPTSQVVAVNAGTTYGQDNSVGNNYGMGRGYMSPARIAHAQAQQDAAPSVWWLIGFFILGAILL